MRMTRFEDKEVDVNSDIERGVSRSMKESDLNTVIWAEKTCRGFSGHCPAVI